MLLKLKGLDDQGPYTTGTSPPDHLFTGSCCVVDAQRSRQSRSSQLAAAVGIEQKVLSIGGKGLASTIVL